MNVKKCRRWIPGGTFIFPKDSGQGIDKNRKKSRLRATRQRQPEKPDPRTTGEDGTEITGVSSQTRRNHREAEGLSRVCGKKFVGGGRVWGFTDFHLVNQPSDRLLSARTS